MVKIKQFLVDISPVVKIKQFLVVNSLMVKIKQFLMVVSPVVKKSAVKINSFWRLLAHA